jgi:hypothetical protein
MTGLSFQNTCGCGLDSEIADGARSKHYNLRLRHAEPAERHGEFLGGVVRLRLLRAEPEGEPDSPERADIEFEWQLDVRPKWQYA